MGYMKLKTVGAHSTGKTSANQIVDVTPELDLLEPVVLTNIGGTAASTTCQHASSGQVSSLDQLIFKSSSDTTCKRVQIGTVSSNTNTQTTVNSSSSVWSGNTSNFGFSGTTITSVASSGACIRSTAVVTGDFSFSATIGSGSQLSGGYGWGIGVFSASELASFNPGTYITALSSLTNRLYVQNDTSNLLSINSGTSNRISVAEGNIVTISRASGVFIIKINGVTQYTYGVNYSSDMYVVVGCHWSNYDTYNNVSWTYGSNNTTYTLSNMYDNTGIAPPTLPGAIYKQWSPQSTFTVDGSSTTSSLVLTNISSSLLISGDTICANGKDITVGSVTQSAVTNETHGFNNTNARGFTASDTECWIIPANYFTNAITSIRFAINPGSGGSLAIQKASIGQASGTGNPYDRSAPLTTITFNSGNISGSTTGGAKLWTDWISCSLDRTKPIVVAIRAASSGGTSLYTDDTATTFTRNYWNTQLDYVSNLTGQSSPYTQSNSPFSDLQINQSTLYKYTCTSISPSLSSVPTYVAKYPIIMTMFAGDANEIITADKTLTLGSYDTGSYGPNLITGSDTYTASTTSQYTPSAAGDNNASTFWESDVELNPWWKVQFATAKTITKITFTNFGGQGSNTGYTIHASNNNSTWSQLYNTTTQCINGTNITATFSNSNAYTYYRVTFNYSSSNALIIYNFYMYESSIITSTNSQLVTSQASSLLTYFKTNDLNKTLTCTVSGSPVNVSWSGTVTESGGGSTSLATGGTDHSTGVTISGNQATQTASDYVYTIGRSSADLPLERPDYFEVYVNQMNYNGGYNDGIGIGPTARDWTHGYPIGYGDAGSIWAGQEAGLLSYGQCFNGVSWTGTSYTCPSAGSILRVAYNPLTGKIWFGIGASWINNGGAPDPASGTYPMFTGLTGTKRVAYSMAHINSGFTFRFDSAQWTYAAPSGFGQITNGNYSTIIPLASTLAAIPTAAKIKSKYNLPSLISSISYVDSTPTLHLTGTKVTPTLNSSLKQVGIQVVGSDFGRVKSVKFTPTVMYTYNITLGTQATDHYASGSLSNGNLTWAGASTFATAKSAISKSSGKWYAEFKAVSGIVGGGPNSDGGVGIIPSSVSCSGEGAPGWTGFVGNGTYGYYPVNPNAGCISGATGSWIYTGGANIANNDIFMIALDLDNFRVWFGRNGTWLNGGNPAAGTNASYSVVSSTSYCMTVTCGGSRIYTANFGGSTWAYSCPIGFTGLHA